MRQMELFVRAYNDGVAFRFKLSRAEKVGDRQITKGAYNIQYPGRSQSLGC